MLNGDTDAARRLRGSLMQMTNIVAEKLYAVNLLARLEHPTQFWHITRTVEYPWVYSKIRSKGERILDVGTNLMFWLYMHAIGHDISIHHTSHDISQLGATSTGVGWLTAAAYLRDAKFQAYVGEPEDLDIKDETFDTITNVSVMEHLPTRKFEPWLNGLWRVLKRGGRMIVTCDWPYEMEYGQGLPSYCNHDWRKFIENTGAVLSDADEVPWASEISPEKIKGDDDVVKIKICNDHPERPDSQFCDLAVYGFILTKP